ncbi:MAG: SPOR domain-containing protein [Bacteroidales bacterium]|nr:SPOR domain-containing protein [Bacteroidales bacterium]MDT8430184.1 SPOR domain-containing protein [Bacteroidales bacterium]
MFFNPKYGKLGLLGYPYWFFFEWLAPILEFVGIIVFIVLAIIGRLNVPFFLLLLGFVYFFAVSVSIWSVLFEEISFHKYEKRRDVLKLMLTAFLEPLFYHPVAMLMNVKGNIDKLFKKSTWGRQERAGFISKNEGNQKKRRIVQKKAFAPEKESVTPSPAAQSGSAAISIDSGSKNGRSPFRQKQRRWIVPAGAISLAASVAVFFLFRNDLSGERNRSDEPADVHTEYAGFIDGEKLTSAAEEATDAATYPAPGAAPVTEKLIIAATGSDTTTYYDTATDAHTATGQEQITGAFAETGSAATSSVEKGIAATSPEDPAAEREDDSSTAQGARMARDAQVIQDADTSGSYHIIVGSFRSRANAGRMAESFKKKGYVTMILTTENLYHRVSLAAFSSLDEALHYTGEMKQDPDLENSWILQW